MINKTITIRNYWEGIKFEFRESFLIPKIIRPSKDNNIFEMFICSRNNLQPGHRFRGDVGL